jgi:hypothetical protein
MAIQNSPDNQKIDYLWKKLGYGVAKTDIAGNIDATQEPYASPLLIRSDTMWQQSGTIPAVLPASNSSVVTVYPTTFPIQCTNDAGIPTPQLTWVTGVTNWIPPEFGSTYQVKVYIAPAGQAANVTTKGTQVFATGSGNNDEWFFDYKAGILNFNSNNTPYSGASPISFTGNAVYISGGVYSGAFGLPSSVSTGNLTFSNTTISTSLSSADIVIAPTGTGVVQMYGNTALWLPTGNTTARPTNASAGYIRFNTDTNNFEYFDGTNWDVPGAATITSATINPDGTSNTYSLGYTTTSAGIIVSINGTLQQPGNAYNVTGNSITFTETPLTTDTIEVRKISAGITSVTSLQYGATNSVTLDGANVTIQGNVLPSANVTYDIGSPTQRWRTGYFSANTINLGGATIGVVNNAFTFTSGGTTQTLSTNGASTSNTFTSSTVTIQGNLAVNGNVTTVGNVAGQYILGSAQFLTGLPIGYSNVNAKAYTETMGFANYSNVNVAAYTQTQSYTNYSNVNLSAYLGGSVTIGSDFTVSGNLLANGSITGGGVRQTTSSSAPSNPTVGDQWYDTSTDILFQYENTGTSNVWVDVSSVAMNTNVATILGTTLSITGNGTITSGLTVGSLTINGSETESGTLTVNSSNNPTAIVNGGTSGVGNIGATGATFNTVYAKATTAQYADLAEIYSSDKPYPSGTVVVFGGTAEVTISTTNHDSAVAGVVSTNPAYLMNTASAGVAVALQGRAHCSVKGPICKGELVVTSDIPGVAQRLDPTLWKPGCVIGKSLETIIDDQIATIEVAVGRD